MVPTNLRTAEGKDIARWGEAEVEDEVWMMHRANNLYVF
jgi:hypothetical protein